MVDLLEKIKERQGKIKVETPKSTIEQETIETTNGLMKQVKLYGKTIPISKLQHVYDWVIFNREDLITAIDHYFRTYMNPERSPAKKDGITDRRNKRMLKLFQELKDF